MAFLPSIGGFYVTDFGRAIRMFAMPGLYPNGSIESLPYVPLCIVAWTPSKRRSIDYVAIGDTAGNVIDFDFGTKAFLR